MSKQFIWLMIVAIFSTHCNIYHLHRGFNESNEIESYIDNGEVKHVIIHIGNAYWELQSVQKVPGGLSGNLVPLATDVDFYYKLALSRGNFKASNIERAGLLQLHIFTNEVTKNGEQTFVPYNKIQFVQLIDKNLGLSALKVTAIAAGVFVVAYGALLLIACNCPHTYQFDGNSWIYTNTLFTGAMNPVLERYDIKQIPDFRPSSSTCQIQLKNEEEETQFTNFLEMVAVYHQKNEKVVANQKGTFAVYTEEINPLSAMDDEGTSQLAVITEKDETSFDFRSVDKVGFSNLYLTFDRSQLSPSSNLIIAVKNTAWSGYLYHEFTKLFGSFYSKWVRSNARKTKKQLDKNIQKAGIYLSVEMKDGGKWKKLENIDLIGEVNYNQLAIPIPQTKSAEDNIQIRLKSGFNFWETDRVFMANTTPASNVKRYTADVDGSEDMSSKLAANDAEYLIHKEGEKPYSITFAGLETDQSRTLFLRSKGYYKSSKSYSGKPDWKKLIQINSVAGLSNFSKDEFEKMAIWQTFFTKVEFSK